MKESRWAVLWWSRHGTGWQLAGDYEEIAIFKTKAEATHYAKERRDIFKADPVFWKEGPWTVIRIEWPSSPRGLT